MEEDEVESLPRLATYRHRRHDTRAGSRIAAHPRRRRAGATAAEGRFPVVVVLGGAHYLSSTAEALASHGFLVVAAFRYADAVKRGRCQRFRVVHRKQRARCRVGAQRARAHPHADLECVSAIGHGGGGMIAMLFAMRNRSVDALANIDSGQFLEAVGNPRQTALQPAVDAGTVPVIATASTRKSQDSSKTSKA